MKPHVVIGFEPGRRLWGESFRPISAFKLWIRKMRQFDLQMLAIILWLPLFLQSISRRAWCYLVESMQVRVPYIFTTLYLPSAAHNERKREMWKFQSISGQLRNQPRFRNSVFTSKLVFAPQTGRAQLALVTDGRRARMGGLCQRIT